MRRAAHDVVKLPIEFSFILSRVFSLKVATFCSNPFEHVYITMATIHGVPYFESYKIKCTTMTVFTSTGKLDSELSDTLNSTHFFS